MADHAVWRGQLRLALVSCPVALFAARRDSASLRFHFINPETGHRVRMISVDAETEAEIPRQSLVRGFEYSKDNYLLLDDEDFEAARIESSNTLKIDKFVPADSIDPLYYDASYFMAPDGTAGDDVFVVLRAAFAKTGRVALSRIVIGRRERPVAIATLGDGMVVHTLHEARDIADAHSVFGAIANVTPDPEMVSLATKLIERQSGRYDPAEDNEDRYEARLRQVIEAKLHGEGITPAAEAAPEQSNVVDLMALLRKSLGGGKAAPPKRAAGHISGGGKPKPRAPAKRSRKPRSKAS